MKGEAVVRLPNGALRRVDLKIKRYLDE